MPSESVLFLALFIGALGLFAAVVIHADWATRQVTPDSAAAMRARANAAKKPNAHSTTPARVHERAA